MADNATNKTDVIVLGAGIVGVSSAYAARQRGMSVVLVDRREPGSETSYGNAGIISSGSIFPLNQPSLFGNLPKYLSNTYPALRWDVGWPLKNPSWIARFLASARASQTKPRAQALHGLIQASLKLHRELDRAGGRRQSYPQDWLAEGVAQQQCRRRKGRSGSAHRIRHQERTARPPGQFPGLEPNILPVYSVGLLHTETASVDLPVNVTKAYAKMFAGSGGEVRHAEIKSIAPDNDGWRVVLSDGELFARHVVVALGPWSADLLRPLGYRVPLATERGYHREFTPNASRKLLRPIHDADNAFLMTPMEQGIRVTSGVELTDRDAPSSYAQLDAVVPLARSVVEFGEPVGDIWRGARPTLPDSLPMIGPAPRHQGLWFAFGNQHIGFTTGPATGEAIAAMIAGAAPSFDTSAFSPKRYV